ncbi:sodium:solute symporter family transporter [Bremerella cremea]|uniref:sodium:solute symporter family transporter n=1 Tax=Bremerella cremea TaxID=1031537 RepID=UPI0031EB7A2F
MSFFATLAITPIDLTIIALYVLGTAILGVYLGRGNHSSGDFFLGSKNLPTWALLLSIVATETSTVTFLSIPGVAFQPGGSFAFLQLALGYIVGRILVLIFILPIYFREETSTAYQVFQRTFGPSTQRMASLFFLIARTLGDGLRLYLAALALQQVTNMPFEANVAILAIVTAFYALLGGVRSVVWNDCLQFAVYMAGAVVIMMLIVQQIPGGVSEYLQFAQETGRWKMFDWRWFPQDGSITIWSGLIGGATLSLATHGADQLIVQRYLCAANQRSAGWALFWSGPIVFVQFTIFLAIGVGLAYFYQQIDPDLATIAGDEALPKFIVQQLPIGITGIVLAAVFAAAMSTLSSSVNSSSSSLLDDWVTGLYPNLSDQRRLRLARGFTLLFTLLQAIVAVGAYRGQFADSVVNQALAIAGFSAGLLLGLMLLAIMIPHVSSMAANLGLLIGASTISVVAIQTNVSGYWYSFICATTTFLATGILGMLFRKSPPSAEITSFEDSP